MSSHEKAHVIDAPLEKEQAYPSTAWAWYTVAILLCAYIFSFIDRQNLKSPRRSGASRPRITDTEMSLLIGFSFAVFYSVLGLPFGRLADSISRPKLIIAGMFTWSLMTGGCGLINSYCQLFLLANGSGHRRSHAFPRRIFDDFGFVSSRKRSVPFSVYTMATYIGGGLAFLLGGLLAPLLRQQANVRTSDRRPHRPWQALFFSSASPEFSSSRRCSAFAILPAKARAFSQRAEGKIKVERIALSAVWKYFLAELEDAAVTQPGNGTRRRSQLMEPQRGESRSWCATTTSRLLTQAFSSVSRKFFQASLGMLTAGKAVAWLTKRGYRDAYMRVAVIAPPRGSSPACSIHSSRTQLRP